MIEGRIEKRLITRAQSGLLRVIAENQCLTSLVERCDDRQSTHGATKKQVSCALLKTPRRSSPDEEKGGLARNFRDFQEIRACPPFSGVSFSSGAMFSTA